MNRSANSRAAGAVGGSPTAPRSGAPEPEPEPGPEPGPSAQPVPESPPGPSRTVRTVLAALLTLGGVAYGAEALRLGTGNAARPGPGLFPLLIGVILTVSGAALVVQTLRGRLVAASDAGGSDADPVGSDTLGGSPPRVRLLTVVGALTCYVVGVGWVGHLITATVVTVLATRLLGGRKWWACAAVGIVAGVVTELVFGNLLGVPLPAGLYGTNL
ncbi:tripartite tricarboxylate transporter TctB family protein [Streptomyces armeniacus]|uniref:Tripartite tricarboxylate transporter TctB family protein n=1 Tax=Streptomyces armeniacus TaxID=83291 RepID=A0A345XPX6_9ACTN|nr:tripartite tricarboxylate transporter TctB family protein [Streptomyces armeniacus]AXK33692.1 tripartite tricarboxylate transporter TctB family protein [Streptomyces armeniacus]